MVDIVSDLVSTIIPVYNRPQMLREAVGSVIAQTHRPVEVIIVDDGSTDETSAVANELVLQEPENVVFLRKANSGPGPSREMGRSVARGEFIQYLDSDDRLFPCKFAAQIEALRRHPECGIAYGLTQLIDADGNVLESPFKWTALEIPQLFPALLVDRWWCTHTPLYRRSLTDALGSWSNLQWSQDWEYDARAGAMGVKLVNCGVLVSEHRQHDGQRQTSPGAWRTDPVRLRNRCDLLSALWSNARKSGVAIETPEVFHFSRWAFAIGRQCAAAGIVPEAKACLKLAHDSAFRNRRAGRGLQIFELLASVLGWQSAGRMASWVEHYTGPSVLTLPQATTDRTEK